MGGGGYEFIYKDWWQEKRYFDFRQGSNTRIRTYTKCKKKLFILILQIKIKSSVWASIKMEETVICLLTVKKFINSKQKILRLQQLHNSIMCYFQWFLQPTLELVLILFIFIGSKRIKPLLILKKQLIKCNSFEHINGKGHKYQA